MEQSEVLRRSGARIQEGEVRLQRLQTLIERRVREGLDTSAAWQLFQLTATAIAHMRHSQSLLRTVFNLGDIGSPTRPLSTAVTAEELSFAAETAIHSGSDLASCYVIESGIASLCFGSATGIEVGVVGPGGLVGVSPSFDGHTVPITAVATTQCKAIPVLPSLAEHLSTDADSVVALLQDAITQQWATSTILARCNAEHGVRERVSRWILTGAHYLRGPIQPISHERISSLLGVRRASVTVALHEIESEGAITSRRDIIQVRSHSTLERLSCGCQSLLLGSAPADPEARVLAPAH